MPSSTPSRRTADSDARANAHDVFTFALRTGALLLRNGASSETVTKTVLAIARTQGYADTTANVTMGQITLGYTPEDDEHPVTRVQNVDAATLDIHILSAVEHLVEDVLLHRVGILEARETLASLADHDKHPRRLRLFGTALMASGFAQLLGADLIVTLVAAVCSIVTEFITHGAARLGLPPFYARALSSFTAVCASALLVTVTPAAQPGIVITAAIVTQLAGSASVGALQDLLTGWLLTACGRLIEASLLTAGLAVGTLAGLRAASTIGQALDFGEVHTTPAGLGVTAPAAGLIAIGFAVYCQTAPRKLLAVTVLGVLGYVVMTLTEDAGLSIVTASAVAAAALGVVTVVVARPMHWPATGALDIAVIPLVPGMALYQALTGFATHDAAATQFLFEAFARALAIGAGAVFGTFLAARVMWRAKESQLRRRERRGGHSLDRAEFAVQDVATPDFRRPFVREDR